MSFKPYSSSMKRIFTFCLSLSLLFFACKKSQVDQNQQPSIRKTQPQISGYLSLTDESGKFYTDNSGMTVSIENSNPIISAVSDSRGHFVLPLNSELTSFALAYNKPGFGTFKQYFTKDSVGNLYSWEFNGNLNSWEFSNSQYSNGAIKDLSEQSSVLINSFNVVIVGDTLRISFNISSVGDGQKYIQLLSQKDLPNISINTIDQSRSTSCIKYAVKNGDNILNLCLKCSEVCNKWISGDVVYFTAYGDSYYSNMYLDRLSNRIILPNLNLNSHIQPVSVVIP